METSLRAVHMYGTDRTHRETEACNFKLFPTFSAGEPTQPNPSSLWRHSLLLDAVLHSLTSSILSFSKSYSHIIPYVKGYIAPRAKQDEETGL